MKSGGAEELAAKRHGDNRETQWLWRLVTATVMVVTMAAMAMVTAAMTAVCDGIRWHGESSRQARQLGQEPYEGKRGQNVSAFHTSSHGRFTKIHEDSQQLHEKFV